MLSDLLSTISITRSRWMVIDLAAGVALRMACPDSLHFLLILRGYPTLRPNNTSPVGMPATTVGLIAPNTAFSMTAGVDDAGRAEVITFGEDEEGLVACSVGHGQSQATVLYGCFEIEPIRWAPLRRMLPTTLVIGADDGHHFPWLERTASLRPLQTAIAGPGADAVSNRWAEVCVVQIIRHYTATPGGGIGLNAGLVGDPKIAHAVREINARPSAPWTVALLARRVGMSRSAFTDGFLSTVGETPFRYITLIRLALACQQLRCEGLSILEIAGQVGYGSDIAFIRTFKRVYGMTPTEYRAQHLKTRHPPEPLESSAYPAFVFWDNETIEGTTEQETADKA
jgi:AraC-like DNA-binding protein